MLWMSFISSWAGMVIWTTLSIAVPSVFTDRSHRVAKAKVDWSFEMDVVGRLTALGVQVPFVERAGEL